MTKQITDNIHWIGISNPASDDFHGIATPRGGSYNSYLIKDETEAIIDTTNTPYFEEWLASLKESTSPEDIKYIIINHAEPDHAGALKQILAECTNAKVVCTEKCKELLVAAFDLECEFQVVGEGEEISLGNTTLRFVMDPLVHWPETMMTYIPEKKFLSSGDLFGTEISHEHMFADEFKSYEKLTQDYFTLIMQPLKMAVRKAVDKVKELELEYIAPSHGPIYRKDLDKVIEYYDSMLENPEQKKITIVYGTIWHSSEKFSKLLAEEVKAKGYEVRLFDVTQSNFIDMMSECMTSRAILLGSLTILGGYHPVFDALFSFLKLNCQQNKNVGLFGTYGWCCASVPRFKTSMKNLNYNVLDTLDFRFGPKTEEDTQKIKNFVDNIITNLDKSSKENDCNLDTCKVEQCSTNQKK